MVALGARDDAQALGLGLLGRRHDGPVALGVHADGLLQEGMDPLGGGVLEMDGTEHGRGGHDDHVHAGVDDLLVGVEAREAVLGGHHLAEFPFDGFARIPDPVGEDVAEGGDGNPVRGGEEVAHGAVAAAAAADQAALEGTAVDGLVRQFGDVVGTGFLQRGEFVALFPAGAGGEKLSAHQAGRADDGGGREEGPSVHFCAHGFSVLC